MLTAAAGQLRVNRFNPEDLHLSGSQCSFDDAAEGTVLASDWVAKFWIKIDGKLVEFSSPESNADGARELANGRWRESMKANDIVLILDLQETGRGDDSATYHGYMQIQQRGTTRRIGIKGGCGA